MTLATGTVLIDRYRVVRLLGQGGFGAVYRVWDLHLNGPFALKENLDASPEATRQFAREAQILAKLQHPNLPRVIDHFSLPDQGQYLVMEYVEGEDLEEKRCKSTCQPAGSLPEEQVLTWIYQILDALEYLHHQNPPIIHRDIKPANIRITPQGRATLVDFGIAKIFNPVLKTTIGARAVTPGFSPLEQYGQGATDARSDIYALGATLYVLLTGITPSESIARAWNDPLQAPEKLNPGLSPAVCIAIKKTLQTDPDDRWQNIAELRNALRKPVTHGGEQISLPGSPLPQTFPARESVLVTPVGSIPTTTPVEEFRPASPVIQEKRAPLASRKSKSRLPVALAAGVGLLLLAVSAITGYFFFGSGLQATATPEHAGAPPAPTLSYGAIPPTFPPEPGGPIRIGLLAPLTGPVPTFGVSDSEGAQLAVKEWNEKGGVLGRPIELIVVDSQCSGDVAPSAANKLITQDGVKFIVGEVCSTASIPVSEITNKNRVVQISPASTNPAVTGDIAGRTKQFVFRACVIDSFQGLVMAKFAVQRGYKTAFIMSDPGNAYVSGLAEAFEKSFADSGGQIVGKETYNSTQQDFSAILARVAASKADVLYVPDYYNVVNLVGVQAKFQGLRAVLMGGDGWDSGDLDVKALDGGFYSNHYDPGDTRPIVQDWLKRYGARYKDNLGKAKVPDAIATLAYDATNMLLAAVQQAGSDDTGQVAQALARLNWNGVTGVITFDQYHNPVKPLVIINVRNGQKVYFATVNP